MIYIIITHGSRVLIMPLSSPLLFTASVGNNLGITMAAAAVATTITIAIIGVKFTE